MSLKAAQPAAARWGLHAFEDPALGAAHARPIWRSDRHPFVLAAVAEPSCPGPNAFTLEDFRELATLAGGPGGEHLLLSNGERAIRLDVEGASLLSGSVRFGFEINGLQSARAKLLVLQRLIALASSKHFLRSLHQPDARARRQILLLRTYDALSEGAGQRTIAAELLNGSAREARWRVASASLRSQAQRLVQGARTMAAGAFWDLLH